MSLVVGMNLGQYALIAADTRLTSYPGPGDEAEFEDDHEKIQRTGIGLVTGVGLSRLLGSVRARLARSSIRHTDDIDDIVREERDRERRGPWYRDFERVRRSVDHETHWVVTYLTPSLAAGLPRLRVVGLGPNTTGLHVVPEGNGVVLFPTGVPQLEASAILALLHDRIRLPEPGELGTSIVEHAQLCAEVVAKVAVLNETVSASFQLGIHTADHQLAISAPMGAELEALASLEFSWPGEHGDAEPDA